MPIADWMNSILSRIEEGSLLPTAYFGGLDCDSALDARDKAGEFEAAFTRLYDEMNRRWTGGSLDQAVQLLAEDVRQESFLAVSRATGQHEIASYASDDFDLVVRSRLVGMNDPLIDHLWAAYERGEFPRPRQS